MFFDINTLSKFILRSKTLTANVFIVNEGGSESGLWSKKSASSWGGRRKLPFAFTEQGIYMLMDVFIRRPCSAAKQNKRTKPSLVGGFFFLSFVLRTRGFVAPRAKRPNDGRQREESDGGPDDDEA